MLLLVPFTHLNLDTRLTVRDAACMQIWWDNYVCMAPDSFVLPFRPYLCRSWRRIYKSPLAGRSSGEHIGELAATGSYTLSWLAPHAIVEFTSMPWAWLLVWYYQMNFRPHFAPWCFSPISAFAHPFYLVYSQTSYHYSPHEWFA